VVAVSLKKYTNEVENTPGNGSQSKMNNDSLNKVKLH